MKVTTSKCNVAWGAILVWRLPHINESKEFHHMEGIMKTLRKLTSYQQWLGYVNLTLLLVVGIFKFQKDWCNLSLITTTKISVFISEPCEHDTSTIYQSNSKICEQC